jgi:hypothetical protein
MIEAFSAFVKVVAVDCRGGIAICDLLDTDWDEADVVDINALSLQGAGGGYGMVNVPGESVHSAYAWFWANLACEG